MTTEPLRGLQLIDEAAREHDRRKEIHPEDVVPDLDGRLDRGQPLAALGLGRDRGVVDERVQFAVVEPLLDLVDRGERVGGIGEIDLDMILRSHLPRAVFREAHDASR